MRILLLDLTYGCTVVESYHLLMIGYHYFMIHVCECVCETSIDCVPSHGV